MYYKVKISIVIESFSHFHHFLNDSEKSLWTMILFRFFYDLYNYIGLGQGQTTPQGQEIRQMAKSQLLVVIKKQS